MITMPRITHLGQWLLDIVLPYECVGCGVAHEWICASCVDQVIPVMQGRCMWCHQPSPGGTTHDACKEQVHLEGVVVTHRKQDILKQLIHLLKYHHVTDIAQVMAQMMVRSVERDPLSEALLLCRDVVLVPVPLHPRREWHRGYNQAALIAQQLGALWNVPVLNTLLRRLRHTQPQAQLSRAARMKNMHNMFALTDDDKSTSVPSTVVLVDDVMTTGATMNDAARALKDAGVSTVYGLVVVRE